MYTSFVIILAVMALITTSELKSLRIVFYFNFQNIKECKIKILFKVLFAGKINVKWKINRLSLETLTVKPV